MKKYKEWLKNEIEIMGSETSENYPHEQMVDREVVLNLIDQLEEPEKVVVPQFVAEAFEKAKGDNTYAEQLITEMYESSDEVGYWLEVPSNEKLLLRAWLDDSYEIEKEKLYYVKLPNTNSESEYLYLAQGNSSGGRWFNSKLELIEYDTNTCQHQFTEAEIKSIDSRYWQFVQPVEEEEE